MLNTDSWSIFDGTACGGIGEGPCLCGVDTVGVVAVVLNDGVVAVSNGTLMGLKLLSVIVFAALLSVPSVSASK